MFSRCHRQDKSALNNGDLRELFAAAAVVVVSEMEIDSQSAGIDRRFVRRSTLDRSARFSL